MKLNAKMLPIFLSLLMPMVCNAQKLGQVACTKQDGSTDLYSSVATMEIRATLKCGQQVQILERYDNFIHVRTDKGEDGFVAFNAITFLKAAATTKSPAAHGTPRPPTAKCDNSARAAESHVSPPPRDGVSPRRTPLQLTLGRTR